VHQVGHLPRDMHGILGTITVKYWTYPLVMSLGFLTCFVLNSVPLNTVLL